MTDWFTTRDGMLARAWDEMEARNATRLWSFAALRDGAWPDVRTVVLRQADRTTANLQFHTDIHSAKIADLSAAPRAGLLCWLPDIALQIRLRATVSVVTGPQVKPVWDAIPDPSREAYGTTPPPATPIADALAYTKPADPTAFAVLYCHVQEIDLTFLGENHRRVLYSRHGDWTGQWVAP